MSYWTRILHVAGVVANLAGLPGFVRECDYQSEPLKASVRVRRRSLYTVVTVNGLDVYFNRLTGTIDGIGGTP